MDKEKAINRLTRIQEMLYREDAEAVGMAIEALAIPSAEPKTCKCRKAHEMIEDRVHCSCGLEMIITGHWDEYNFCPRCGCRMVEPQESEDKE